MRRSQLGSPASYGVAQALGAGVLGECRCEAPDLRGEHARGDLRLPARVRHEPRDLVLELADIVRPGVALQRSVLRPTRRPGTPVSARKLDLPLGSGVERAGMGR